MGKFALRNEVLLLSHGLWGLMIYLGLAEKVHKTNLDATGREKW
jgi:hypothetical protein